MLANWKAPHWASAAGSAFLGGGLGALQAALLSSGAPTTRNEVVSIALGFVVAGLIAVQALYRTPPGKTVISLPQPLPLPKETPE